MHPVNVYVCIREFTLDMPIRSVRSHMYNNCLRFRTYTFCVVVSLVLCCFGLVCFHFLLVKCFAFKFFYDTYGFTGATFAHRLGLLACLAVSILFSKCILVGWKQKNEDRNQKSWLMLKNLFALLSSSLNIMPIIYPIWLCLFT